MYEVSMASVGSQSVYVNQSADYTASLLVSRLNNYVAAAQVWLTHHSHL
jgi:hypothetical protein